MHSELNGQVKLQKKQRQRETIDKIDSRISNRLSIRKEASTQKKFQTRL
jgi:hypothetical protein